MKESCPSCGEEIPNRDEHCVITRRDDKSGYHFVFKRGEKTLLAFELTQFQMLLMCRALAAGNAEGA